MSSTHQAPMSSRRALVVFESMFGNTEQIARAIGDGLAPRMQTDVVEVGEAPGRIDGVDLLIIGGPTHAFGMTRPGTRRSAAQQAAGALVSRGIGVREWLAALPTVSSPVAAASFDTRLRRPRLPGSAARAARRRLRRLGFDVIDTPQTFWVVGTPGPLLDGEIERARRWGDAVAAACLVNRHVAG